MGVWNEGEEDEGNSAMGDLYVSKNLDGLHPQQQMSCHCNANSHSLPFSAVPCWSSRVCTECKGAFECKQLHPTPFIPWMVVWVSTVKDGLALCCDSQRKYAAMLVQHNNKGTKQAHEQRDGLSVFSLSSDFVYVDVIVVFKQCGAHGETECQKVQIPFC